MSRNQDIQYYIDTDNDFPVDVEVIDLASSHFDEKTERAKRRSVTARKKARTIRAASADIYNEDGTLARASGFIYRKVNAAKKATSSPSYYKESENQRTIRRGTRLVYKAELYKDYTNFSSAKGYYFKAQKEDKQVATDTDTATASPLRTTLPFRHSLEARKPYTVRRGKRAKSIMASQTKRESVALKVTREEK